MRRGFTLIELAIVLVIVGLLIGGILLGRSMIEQAELRQMASFHGKVRSAINTFRLKYGGLPGDIDTARASAMGLSTCSISSVCGNENGMVQPTANPLPRAQVSIHGEPILFWRHLAQAGLLATSVNPTAALAAATASPPSLPATAEVLAQYLPQAPLGGYYHIANGFSGLPYLQIGINVSSFEIPMQPAIAHGAVLTPLHVYYIDSKIDDGIPASGLVWEYCGSAPPDLPSGSHGSPCAGVTASQQMCSIMVGASYRYNIGGSGASLRSCEMVMSLPEINP